MVTARIAGLSPGTSPPPVRIPIRPFLVLMRPFVVFFEQAKGKSTEAIGCARGIAQSPRVSLLAIYHKPLTMHEPARCRGGRRGGCEVSVRDDTVFRVTNSRCHANPLSDRVSFR